MLKATIHPVAARAGGEGDLLFSLSSPDDSWEGKRLRVLLNWPPRTEGGPPRWWVREAENGIPDCESWDPAAFTEFEVRFHPRGCRQGVNCFAMTLRGEVRHVPEPPIVRCRIAVAPILPPGEYVQFNCRLGDALCRVGYLWRQWFAEPCVRTPGRFPLRVEP